MPIAQELGGFSRGKDGIVTIGVFDGVHLGHKYLISKLKELAGQQGLHPFILTFDKHPQEILNPAENPLFLSDADEKSRLLKNEGIDDVIVLPFTRELAEIDARIFIDLLIEKLHMKSLVIGPDFALGRGAKGNITAIHEFGKQLGFSVTVIPPVKYNDEIISSTSIRKALAEGDMRKVQQFMGRPFSLHGRVIRGFGRGTGVVGFPTVNLNILPGQALPADGVYATRASVEDRVFSSVTNVGKNPTFGNKERTIESFLLDFHNNLYEHEVKIDFIQKLRGEIKFPDTAALTQQIETDIKHTRAILSIEAKDKDE